MRKQEIQELIRLVEESKISELEICEGKRKIRITKHRAVAQAAGSMQALPASRSSEIAAVDSSIW